jgi:predicted DNA binding protein
VVYRDGWEEHKAMGFTDKDYKKLFHDLAKLGPVEVLEKRIVPGTKLRDTFAISISGIFSELTRKQVDALVAALEYGYYQTPRRMTAKEIAGKLKVPRTTYEEHVRKAERKVLRAMAPYVKLYGTYSPRMLEAQPRIMAE